MNEDKELIYCGDEYTPPQYIIREKPTVEVKLHTIATYNNQEYELEELCNGFLEEIERLNNIIKDTHKLLRDTYKELSSYLPTDDNCELMSRIANMIGKIKN